MSSLINLTPSIKNFDQYLNDINAGIIQIPEFQRDFVWDLENVINLLESIKKNYPIGSFLFWKPDTSFNISKNLGPYVLKDFVLDAFEKINNVYILDGYQRMSSLFGCLMNPNEVLNFELNRNLFDRIFNVYYDLKDECFVPNRGGNAEKESCIVPVNVFLDYEAFLTYSEKINKMYPIEEAKIFTDRLKRIITTFMRYQMPVIEISGGSLDEAIDIFTLLNKEGKAISPDWILSAKTYSSDFRMGDEIDNALIRLEYYNFIDKKPKELAVRELIFRSIQSSFGDLYLDTKKTDIITLSKKSDFVEVVLNTCQSVEFAAKFLYEQVGVVDNKLLPANMQFIFLVEFFNHIKKPSIEQISELKKWFWQTAYFNYFTIFNPSKRKTAFQFFQNYILRIQPIPLFMDKFDSFIVPELSDKINLSGVRSKVFMLFLLNYSNHFNEINPEFCSGYKMMRLFNGFNKYDISKSGEFTNTMLFYINKENILLLDLIKKRKATDLSFLLEIEFKGQYHELFITDEMRDYYLNDDINKVLEIRFSAIQTAEKYFIENLI